MLNNNVPIATFVKSLALLCRCILQTNARNEKTDSASTLSLELPIPHNTTEAHPWLNSLSSSNLTIPDTSKVHADRNWHKQASC